MPFEDEKRVEFVVDGETVRGTLRYPSGVDGPVGAVALGHGWSMTAGGDLEEYAKAITARGIATLTFDFRNLGLSDGSPRQELNPWKQVEDYRGAVTFLRRQDHVDPARIGIWGTSYSGGHVLVAAATDPRVACLVSQVPTIDGYAAAKRRNTPEQLTATAQMFIDDHEARADGQNPQMVQTIQVDPSRFAAYPQPDSFAYMSDEGARATGWINGTTLRSLELARQYAPGKFIERIGDRPVMMIIADNDVLTPTDFQREAFEALTGPKELVVIPGGHYDVYTSALAETKLAAADWFERWLGPAHATTATTAGLG